MNLETGVMYEKFVAGHSPEERAAMDSALSVDPGTISYTVIALDGDEPVGHSALRPVGSTGQELEVKKVYVAPSARGTGVAKQLMAHLEEIARASGVGTLVLQTGVLQVDAIALYEKIGYRPIAPFGAYAAIPGALCYEKTLR